jgi:vacuolar-type H+-ATPase subunit D/Vma8
MSAIEKLQKMQERLAVIDEQIKALDDKREPLVQEKKDLKGQVALALEVADEIRKEYQEHYNALCISAIESGSAGLADLKTFAQSASLKYELDEEAEEEGPPILDQTA